MENGNVWKSYFRPDWIWLTALTTVVVLALTHVPDYKMRHAQQMQYLDKAEHMVAYGLIAGFFLLSLKCPVRPAVLVIGLLAVAVIGVLDEVTQPLVNRSADIWDYGCDLIGIAIAGMLVGAGRVWRSSVALRRRRRAIHIESPPVSRCRSPRPTCDGPDTHGRDDRCEYRGAGDSGDK